MKVNFQQQQQQQPQLDAAQSQQLSVLQFQQQQQQQPQLDAAQSQQLSVLQFQQQQQQQPQLDAAQSQQLSVLFQQQQIALSALQQQQQLDYGGGVVGYGSGTFVGAAGNGIAKADGASHSSKKLHRIFFLRFE
ncbi:hypothetical protein GPALN_003336 [Globodera pallida]|nr:hypothetical protein GPALN_003336 [Globodera pallida]